MFEKQPFIDHLQNRRSWIIHKIHSKKPVLESLFNKVAVLRTCNFIEEDSDTGAFLWNLQTFWQTQVWRSLFNKVASLTAWTHLTVLKRDSRQVFPWEVCGIFRKAFLQSTSKQPLLTWCCFFYFADQWSLQPKINLFGGAMINQEKDFTSPFNAM